MTGRLLVSTLGSLGGFVTALILSQVVGWVLGGAASLFAGHFSSIANAIAFVVALAAIPTGAIVGYAAGANYVAERQTPTSKPGELVAG